MALLFRADNPGDPEYIYPSKPIDLTWLQEQVSGNIETLWMTRTCEIYVNEEGLNRELPPNQCLAHTFWPFPVRGNAVMTVTKNGKTIRATEATLRKILKKGQCEWANR